MTTPHWAAVLLTMINVLCACIYLWAPRRHHHAYDDWSDWMQDVVNEYWGKVQATRYRTCRTCSHVEHQEAGYHRCIQIAGYQKRATKECPHLAGLIGNGPERVKRLEDELGL